jgi:NAD(P)-dependent dehydrogenase (short-subunit alcohol dehydrogenase family)
MQRLAGKVALITGASRGIGKGIALKFGKEGAKVVVNYSSNQGQAEEVVATIKAEGGEAMAIQANVSDVAQIERMVNEAVAAYGNLDILVSNAGVEHFSSLAESTVEDFDRVFGINTRGQYFAAQQAVKHMNDGGRVLLTSSISVTKGMPGHSFYAGSKAAVEIFARNLAVELGSRGITVNTVAPGATTSDMSAEAGKNYGDPYSTLSVKEQLEHNTALGRWGTAADIANVMTFLASEEGGWITGQTVYATGGYRP